MCTEHCNVFACGENKGRSIDTNHHRYHLVSSHLLYYLQASRMQVIHSVSMLRTARECVAGKRRRVCPKKSKTKKQRDANCPLPTVKPLALYMVIRIGNPFPSLITRVPEPPQFENRGSFNWRIPSIPERHPLLFL